MAEYGKKTVADLTEILKSRGLPSSGKKAELIARLNEDDKQTASKPAEEPATESAQPTPAAQETAAPEAPTQPKEATTAENNTKAAKTTTSDQAPEPTEPEPSTTYTLNLKASDLDSEIAKRKARAERFGTSGANTTTNPETADDAANQESTDHQQQQDDQAQKNLERAKRFGTESKAISKLDEALPSERARGSHKRKADESTLDDPGLKRGFGGRGGGGGGGRGRGRFRRGGAGAGAGARTATQGSRPQGINKQPAYTSEKDKLAAEARRKKFATA